MSGAWRAGDARALAWIESIASDRDEAGYGVGPLPDKIWVLHPLHERLDGLPMQEGREIHKVGVDGDAIEIDVVDETMVPDRVLRWRDYAHRRGIPMFVPPGYASLRDALPGVWDDEYVSPPGEGKICNSITQRALFDILLQHSGGAGATAYYYCFWVGGPTGAGQLPNVLHGPLASWQELFARPGYVLGPQNIWPDDRTWVMRTHTDSWATEISGPGVLIDELVACSDLETIRLSYLG